MARHWIAALACVAAVGAAHAQLQVRRVPGRLGEQTSSWNESPQPQSTWTAKPIASNTSTGGPASALAPAATPASEFDLADVPPAKLAATRTLLGETNARSGADGAIVIDLPGDVLFDFDKHDLRPDALATLEKLAALLGSFPRRAVAVEGHTDAKGSDGYNDALSRRRADAVQRYLADHDASPQRHYEVRGYGEKRPVAPNAHADGSDDPQGRQKNRRVEVVLRAAR